ncbi:hypothetical protein HDV00_002218 [Rhizophlyctis rosea]|nr:hypothetical protein HDV00_002218 [Rhizophlyctis rosea]
MVQKTTFIQKLHNILEDENYRHLICWGNMGTSFLVLDSVEFSKSVLPKVFKHNNYTSFVRQLNLYGFHKKNRSYHRHTGTEADRERDAEPREFSHPLFIRSRPDLLIEIRRKATADNKDNRLPSLGGPISSPSINSPYTSCHACTGGARHDPHHHSHHSHSHSHSHSHIDDRRYGHHNHGHSFGGREMNGSDRESATSGNRSPLSPPHVSPIDTDRDNDANFGMYGNNGHHHRSSVPQSATTHQVDNTSSLMMGLTKSASSSNNNNNATNTAALVPAGGMTAEMQGLMMKHLSQLQTNVLELVAELRDVRKRCDAQQGVIEELVREVRRNPSVAGTPSNTTTQQDDLFTRLNTFPLTTPTPQPAQQTSSSQPLLPPPSILASFTRPNASAAPSTSTMPSISSLTSSTSSAPSLPFASSISPAKESETSGEGERFLLPQPRGQEWSRRGLWT